MAVKFIYCTFGSKADFEKMAEELLMQGLIACANGWEIFSIYSDTPVEVVKLWKGKEYAGLFKTTERDYKKACDYIIKNHKYKVPAVLVVDGVSMNKLYSKWLEEVCSRKEQDSI